MTECGHLTFIRGRPPQVAAGAEEQTRECREQEYKDRFGSCKPCRQCDAGQELSQVGTPHFTSPSSPVLQVKLKESAMLAELSCRAYAYSGKRKCRNTKDTQQAT